MAEYELREQDKWLPIANVSRIMKNALPDNAKISKEAKECMQECVSEFVSFITSEASEKCCAERRKTVNGEDILFAMMSLGFENYAEVLKIYLTKYRQAQNLKQEREHRQKQERVAAEATAAAEAAAAEAEAVVASAAATGDEMIPIDAESGPSPDDDLALNAAAAAAAGGLPLTALMNDSSIKSEEEQQQQQFEYQTANLHDIENAQETSSTASADARAQSLEIGMGAFDYAAATAESDPENDPANDDGTGNSSNTVSRAGPPDTTTGMSFYDDYSPMNGTYSNNVEMAPY
ncbi:uncharacterized protein SAPINGB_P001202 [Magnusiomyces paraingens]|uniref:Transcription factor CBF/NF-Y/archaeal histone domain-containing protein n=1 Tax=Magnusiomyces paraingens TaxID=2606893 RepID=A0A5E8B537_9ASCO|nr:uncharacterized protein SAPINGB_P001202 [Saprochaete ingens]VVT46415.1 unnamed protein product [Saprochaete ingens]